MSLTSPLGSTYGARLNAYLTTFEDFRKHRKRLNKSLLKLRHDLGLITRDTRNYKEKEKTSTISAENYDSDPRYGLLLLLLAERDSLYASEIKSLLEISGEKLSSYKRLMVSKLKKAVGTNQKLLAATANEPNDLKKLEFFVFAALGHGIYAVNKKQWSQAIYAYSVARCGLELLGAQLSELENELQFNKTLLDDLLDTVVDPSLNLAVSQEQFTESTSDLRTVARKHCHDATVAYLAPAVSLISSIDQSFVEEPQEEEISKSVTWRDHEAQIYNDELSVKIVKLTKTNWRLFAEPNDYDSLYSRWSALVDIHSADLAKNRDEDDVDKVQDGAVLLTYLKYNMLFTRLKRDLLVIDQLASQAASIVAKKLHCNRDVLRLYNAVISTIDELKDLPGVYNDEDLFDSLENMGRFFTVKRSVVVADSYAIASKFPEALKIYAQVERTFDVSGDFYKVDEFPYEVTSNTQAKALSSSIGQRRAKIQGLAQFHRENSSDPTRVVVDDVYKFPVTGSSIDKITNVVHKGKLTPVLSKAVLFDVAFNYISYRSSGETTVEESDEKKKSGFFGIFGR